MFDWFVFVCLFLRFLWEHIAAVWVILLSIIAAIFIFPKIYDLLNELLDRYLYKDEPPEKRKERLKQEKMIREWRRKNHF